MFPDKNSPFLLLVVISFFNILLSYTFGNNGYEAFITVSIALGLLITWQSAQVFRFIRKSSNWLVIKCIYTLALGFFWFNIIAVIMLSVSQNSYDPSVNVPAINWLIVLVGVIPYLLPRISYYHAKLSFKRVAIGWVATTYSVVVLFIAVLGFYNSETKYGGLLLVLAIQLQYLMNHLVVKTDYTDHSHVIALKLAKRLHVEGTELGRYLIVAVVGLPFIIPLAIVMLVVSISK